MPRITVHCIVLDGGGTQRGLFVYAGTVNIQNLTISNMVARGGTGGGGTGGGGGVGGGGGAGLGGGLFIANNSAHGAAPSNVTLTNVTFAKDTAAGGAGGAGGSARFGGGGGGARRRRRRR